jgi:homopolymeric O-antigen transport system ATP-binding protein
METVIRFENVSKRYRLGHPGGLRDAIAGLPQRLASIGRPKRDPSFDQIQNEQYLWALRDTTFNVNQGEVLGIIGPNGAGKSTILKLIAGITRPTQGWTEIRGRVGSLIELGAGFHPDLTGRENVFLNCQLMGMTPREVAERYESIVEFAELREFMDVAVKRYSTGMYARLGFAVAAHTNMEILLVDEVLSVGDMSFQRKSLERMSSLVKSGRTILFVSHNLFAVEQMCDRAIWLTHGSIQRIGQTREVIQAYLDNEENRFVSARQAIPKFAAGFWIECVQLVNGDAESVSEFHAGRDIEIQVEYHATQAIEGLRFGLGVANAASILFIANMLIDGVSIDVQPGKGTIQCRFKNVPLRPGAYQLFGEVWGRKGLDIIMPWAEWSRFRIAQIDELHLSIAEQYSVTHMQSAPIYVPYEWREGTL